MESLRLPRAAAMPITLSVKNTPDDIVVDASAVSALVCGEEADEGAAKGPIASEMVMH